MFLDCFDAYDRDEFDALAALDTDEYTPPLPTPRTVSGMSIVRMLRARGADRIAVGEIVPVTQVVRGLGQLVQRNLEGSRGSRALVAYDSRGNVFMQVFSAAMNPTTRWMHIGAVGLAGLPAEPSARGTRIEARIRQLVSRATRVNYRIKWGNARGADLQPTGKRISGSLQGVGQAQFDDFLDEFDEWWSVFNETDGISATRFG